MENGRMFIIMASLIIIYLGWFIFSKPEKMWEMRYQFFVKSGEPTRYAIFCIRLPGIILLLAGAMLTALYILEIISNVSSKG